MKTLASSIRWNTLFAFLSQAIRLLSNLVLFVGIARFYGPEAFGQFTFAHTLSALFLVFADFGFDTLLATEVARNRARASEIARQFFSIKILFALVATAAVALSPVVHSMSASTRLLIEIFSLNVFFTSLSNFFFALFKGYEQLQHETKISFITNILSLCLLVAAWILKLPIELFAAIFIVTRICGFALALRLASRSTGVRFFRLDYSAGNAIVKQVMVFGLLNVFGNLCFQLDTIMLASMTTTRDVGVYQAVFKLVLLVHVVPEIATATLMPVLARLNGENEAKWNSLGRLLNRTLTFSALVISLVLFIFADQIINLVYGGKGFAESVSIMRIFCLVIVVRFAVETYGLMLTTSLRQRRRMLVVMAATALNFLLNLYAIPRYGTTGAAVVALVTNLFIGAGYVVATKSFFSGWALKPKDALSLAFIACIAVVLWYLRLWPVYYVAPVAVCALAGVLFLLGYTPEERMLVFATRRSLPTDRA